MRNGKLLTLLVVSNVIQCISGGVRDEVKRSLKERSNVLGGSIIEGRSSLLILFGEVLSLHIPIFTSSSKL